MVTIIGDQIFYGDKNPFVLVQGSQNEGNKKKKKKWISTLDLAFLFCFLY